MRLSSRLLDELKARFPTGTIDELFNSVVQQIVDDSRKDFEGLTFEQRLDYLVNLLAEEGFLASWESTGDRYILTEYSCPYYAIGQKHNEVCTFDRQLVQIILDTDIEQKSCMLHGDSRCQFTFSLPVSVN